MKHLFTWKIKESPNCAMCLTSESLKHAIFECPVAVNAWNHFKNILNIEIDFQYKDVLLGTSTTKSLNLNQAKLHSIDTLLILVKQRLILQRENKRNHERQEIISLITDRISLEKFNSRKYNLEKKYNTKWKWLEGIIGL